MVRSRMLLGLSLALLLLSASAVAGCGSDATSTPKSAPDGSTATEQPPAEEAAPGFEEGETMYTPEYKPNGSETAVIKTSKGTIVVKLYGKDAPIHVGNFVELVQKGYYDGVKFHRYEPGFVIQGGDPQTKDMSSVEVSQSAASGGALGTGGPGYVIKGEFDPKVNPNKHDEGALGMARTMDPDSAGSQFYFALQPLAQLDGGYTVFGITTEGLDVVKALRVGDEIESVEIRGGNE